VGKLSRCDFGTSNSVKSVETSNVTEVLPLGRCGAGHGDLGLRVETVAGRRDPNSKIRWKRKLAMEFCGTVESELELLVMRE
jgi:hypothetical protein